LPPITSKEYCKLLIALNEATLMGEEACATRLTNGAVSTEALAPPTTQLDGSDKVSTGLLLLQNADPTAGGKIGAPHATVTETHASAMTSPRENGFMFRSSAFSRVEGVTGDNSPSMAQLT
jgi:hypothetical protein